MIAPQEYFLGLSGDNPHGGQRFGGEQTVKFMTKAAKELGIDLS